MTLISQLLVISFGFFIFLVGLLMMFNPKKARSTLRKAGSTTLNNYAEITIRLIPAIALILYAQYSRLPIAFSLLGWIMVVTSIILYAIPRKWHHDFSLKAADLLKPLYFQLIAPFAFLFGILIIYNAI